MSLNIGHYYYIPSLLEDGRLQRTSGRLKNFLIDDGTERWVNDSIPALTQMIPGRVYRTPDGPLTFTSNNNGWYRFMERTSAVRLRRDQLQLMPHEEDNDSEEETSDSEEEDNDSEDVEVSDSEAETSDSEAESSNSEADTSDSEAEATDSAGETSDPEGETSDSEAETTPAGEASDSEEETREEESVSVYSGNIAGFPSNTATRGSPQMLRELSIAQIRSTSAHSAYLLQEVTTQTAVDMHSRLLEGYTSIGRGVSTCLILLRNDDFHSIERLDTRLTRWTLDPYLNHLDLNTRCIVASCVHRRTGRQFIFISYHGMHNGGITAVEQCKREMKRFLSDLARDYPGHVIICGGDFNYNVTNNLPRSFGAIPYSMARPRYLIDHILYRNAALLNFGTLNFYEPNETANRVYPLDLNRFLPADRARLMAISNDTRRWGNCHDHDVRVAVLRL